MCITRIIRLNNEDISDFNSYYDDKKNPLINSKLDHWGRLSVIVFLFGAKLRHRKRKTAAAAACCALVLALLCNVWGTHFLE